MKEGRKKKKILYKRYKNLDYSYTFMDFVN